MERINDNTFYVARAEFKRYSYTATRVECLMRRGHSLRPKVFVLKRFGHIRIVLICERRGRECKTFFEHVIDQIQALNNGTVNDNSKKHDDEFTLEPTVTVVHSNCYISRSDFDRNQSELILLINGNKRMITEFEEKHKSSHISITSTEDIIKSTNLLLERYVCWQLKEMVDTLIAELNVSKNCFHYRHLLKPAKVWSVLQLTPPMSPLSKGFLTSDANICCTNVLQSTKRKDADFERGTLRCGKRFKPLEQLDTDRYKIEVYLLDVMTMLMRSDVPQLEWPRLEYPSKADLNPKILARLSKIDPMIFGCGYQHNILEIVLNREPNRRLDGEIIKELQMHQVLTYHFNYGPCKYTPLMGLNVGTTIGRNGRFATLGGFARSDGDLYALTSRHFAEEHNGQIYSMNNGGQSDHIAVWPQQAQHERTELDIAAVRILPNTEIQDTRFKDSTGALTNSILFNFEDKTDNDIQHILQGELVFAWTANSNASPSIGRIIVPLFERPTCTYKYVIIVNENVNDDNASFGKTGNSGAIVCSDDKDENSVHVISMFMGELRGQDITQFSTLPLQQGLQQINTEFGLNLQLC